MRPVPGGGVPGADEDGAGYEENNYWEIQLLMGVQPGAESIVMTKQASRKPHRDFIGYRAELRNLHSGGHTIILDCKLAVQQGHPLVVDWDEEGGRYQVLCNSHSNIIHCTSMSRARSAMKDPLGFCDTCRDRERLSRGILAFK